MGRSRSPYDTMRLLGDATGPSGQPVEAGAPIPDPAADGDYLGWLLNKLQADPTSLAPGTMPGSPPAPGDSGTAPPPNLRPGVNVIGPLPAGFVAPGAVAFRPGNWDEEHGEYVVAPGDTMVGIAALYLSDGARWGEIRDYQAHSDTERGPNGLYLNAQNSKWYPGSTAPGAYFQPGRALVMPPEALAKAQDMIHAGAPQATPTTGAPVNRPEGYKPAPLGTASGGATGGPASKGSFLKMGVALALGYAAVKLLL